MVGSVYRKLGFQQDSKGQIPDTKVMSKHPLGMMLNGNNFKGLESGSPEVEQEPKRALLLIGYGAFK